jgi:prepilin-type N-terminal cleavage/methylation domain-containing protein
MHKYEYRKGFSLAEAMMATVVLGIAAAGVLMPFTSGARMHAEAQHRLLASKLASDLIEQIETKPFDQIISAYNGYSEAQGQIKNASGVVFTDSNYANFSRAATCQLVYVGQEKGTTAAQFIKATVTVSYKGSPILIVNKLISK